MSTAFTFRPNTGRGVVDALDTFDLVAEAAEPDKHIRRAGARKATALFHVLHCASIVEPFQPIADFLDKKTTDSALKC